MFTQSSSLGLQIAFRFGVAPPLSSELFPTPARSSLSSSAVTSVSSFCLPTPGSRGLGAAGTPHRTDQDHGRVGWNPAPQALQHGLCRLWETPSSSPSQCWEVKPSAPPQPGALRNTTPGMRDQSTPRVFADHEWVPSSASPASAGTAGSGWSSGLESHGRRPLNSLGD